jgi:hypothetical protein
MASKNSSSWGEFTKADGKRGYRVLGRGYPSICDPDRDGADADDYGSSYDYNWDGTRIYKRDRNPGN